QVRGPVREDRRSEDGDHGDSPVPTFPSAVKSWHNGTTGLGARAKGGPAEHTAAHGHTAAHTAAHMAAHTAAHTAAHAAHAGPRRWARGGSRTRRWRRLDEFVVGPCNRVAHASALSIVEAPGQDANPLVVHGPVGTGKTHLLEGVALGLRRRYADWRVCFTTA